MANTLNVIKSQLIQSWFIHPNQNIAPIIKMFVKSIGEIFNSHNIPRLYLLSFELINVGCAATVSFGAAILEIFAKRCEIAMDDCFSSLRHAVWCQITTPSDHLAFILDVFWCPLLVTCQRPYILEIMEMKISFKRISKCLKGHGLLSYIDTVNRMHFIVIFLIGRLESNSGAV